MKAYVFVEEASDAAVLTRLMPAALAQDVQLVSAQGMGSLASLARSVLATRRKPAAVIVDSYSVAPELIRDRRQNLEDLSWLVASGVPTKVVMAVPELRAIFFHDPHLLPKVLGRELPAEVLIRARYEPGRGTQGTPGPGAAASRASGTISPAVLSQRGPGGPEVGAVTPSRS